MNLKYIVKNPSPSPQTITLPQGLSLDGGRLRSTRPVVVQVPPMSMREILFNENGVPVNEGCIQDLNVAHENDDGTPIDPHSDRRERTRIRNVTGDRPAMFVSEARRVYPNLVVDDTRNLGGAQLLAQFSHLRSARDNTTAIYSPAALNMTYESRTDSLYHAANTGKVEIQSIIGNGYNRSNAITMQVHNPATKPCAWSCLAAPWWNSRLGPASRTSWSTTTCGSTSNPPNRRFSSARLLRQRQRR